MSTIKWERMAKVLSALREAEVRLLELIEGERDRSKSHFEGTALLVRELRKFEDIAYFLEELTP